MTSDDVISIMQAGKRLYDVMGDQQAMIQKLQKDLEEAKKEDAEG